MSAGWDCHAHVFGPYADFPLACARSYTPPEAPLDAYLALLQGTDPTPVQAITTLKARTRG